MNYHVARDAGDAERWTESAGEEIYAFASQLFPICRSITGEGVRDTLRLIAQSVPLQITEIPTGTRVFDWVVPREWTIRDAYIKNERGERIVDFRRSNLHVLNYSIPVNRRMSLDELRPNLHTLPDQPDLIPYRTSYYAEQWGFCLSHRQLSTLTDGTYEVVIDSSMSDGHLVYGEYFHKGESETEVMLSAHICHPSLANDNCSGMAVLAQLAARMQHRRTRLSYRFLFAPGTIGTIAWLCRNEANAGKIAHGLVLAGIGDRGNPTYKRTRRGNAKIDRVMESLLETPEFIGSVVDFSPYGYDERQYASPGFNLNVGLLQRSPFATFPQYHTSADDLDFITPASLQNSYELVSAAIDVLEADRTMVNLAPKCEPQLGRRNVFDSIGGKNPDESRMAVLWALNMSDGTHSLFDIAERADLPFATVAVVVSQLEEVGLLRSVAETAVRDDVHVNQAGVR